MFNKNFKELAFVFSISFSFILFSISIYNLYNHFQNLNEIKENYRSIEKLTLNSLDKRQEKTYFLNKYKNSDPKYLINFFKNKNLLSEERNNLVYLNKQALFHGNPLLLEKIAKIDENKFDYLIGDSIEKKNIEETPILLKYPILCNYKDLEQTLSIIDNISTNNTQIAPQIIPYYLYIEFNKFNCKFDFKILQREFK